MTDVFLENEERGTEFIFGIAEGLGDDISRDVTSIALPSNSQQDTVLFPLTGVEEDISWDFILYEDGTDFSNGTANSGTIETLDEQVEFLRNEIFTPGISDTVLLTSPPYLDNTAVRGVITSLNINAEGGRTTIYDGSATVKLGKIGLF